MRQGRASHRGSSGKDLTLPVYLSPTTLIDEHIDIKFPNVKTYGATVHVSEQLLAQGRGIRMVETATGLEVEATINEIIFDGSAQ